MRHEFSVFEWGEAGGRVRSWIRFPAEAGEFGVISRLTWDFGQVYLVDRLGIGWGGNLFILPLITGPVCIDG